MTTQQLDVRFAEATVRAARLEEKTVVLRLDVKRFREAVKAKSKR